MALGKTNITVELPNGTKISGKAEEVRKTLRSLGLDPNRYLNSNGLYYSESRREYIPVGDMNTTHLRNAILKSYGTWLNDLRIMDNKQMLRALTQGPEDLLPLIAELTTRKDE